MLDSDSLVSSEAVLLLFFFSPSLDACTLNGESLPVLEYESCPGFFEKLASSVKCFPILIGDGSTRRFQPENRC